MYQIGAYELAAMRQRRAEQKAEWAGTHGRAARERLARRCSEHAAAAGSCLAERSCCTA